MRVPLPRMQLFEFMDLANTPKPLRDVTVEALSRTLEWGRMQRGLLSPFQRFLGAAGTREVLDLGSGAGGPARVLIREHLRVGASPPRFILTDLRPQLPAWERMRGEYPGVVDFIPEPVNACRIPENVATGRARCIINALHHLPPTVAQSVLADAVRSSQGIFVAEAFERNPLRFLSFAPAGMAALLSTPLLTPTDRIAKTFYTWATPVALAVSIWDGTVSALRMYTEAELRAMVAPLGDSFTWTYGTYPYVPFGRGVFFYGVPRPGTCPSSMPNTRTISSRRARHPLDRATRET